MTINQLFKQKIPTELVDKLVKSFGLESLDDDSCFSKVEIEKNKTIDMFNNYIKELEDYYLPCKKKVYLNNLNYKRCITILRQCIKLYGYNVKSKEKYIKGDKLIIYQIINKNEPKNIKKDKEKECVISFD